MSETAECVAYPGSMTRPAGLVSVRYLLAEKHRVLVHHGADGPVTLPDRDGSGKIHTAHHPCYCTPEVWYDRNGHEEGPVGEMNKKDNGSDCQGRQDDRFRW